MNAAEAAPHAAQDLPPAPVPSFPVTRFPPACAVRGAPKGKAGSEWSWFPVPLLLDQLSRCTCGQAAAYIVTGLVAADELTYTACFTACEEHVCQLAGLISDHTLCPKCHIRWVGPPRRMAVEILTPAAPRGA